MIHLYLKLRYLILFLFLTTGASAQPSLHKDYSMVMEIPSVVTMGSSAAHLYVLSKTEGMAVFRTHPDNLQWLYSSTGMEQRGYKMTGDIRFAYLFGDSRRMTVLEPTSVLGVYSSTLLPSQPMDAKRIDQNLYVALGKKGLGKLSLRTPAAVDSTMDLVARSKLSDQNIVDLEESSNQFFALSKQSKLFKFKYINSRLSLLNTFDLSQPLTGIYLVKDNLYGSDSNGNIYDVSSNGSLEKLGSIGESIQKMAGWKDWLIIKGSSNRIWTSYSDRAPRLWKDDKKAGNFFTVTQNHLWLCEYNKISKIVASSRQNQANATGGNGPSGKLALKPIPDQTIADSNPLLIPIKFTSDISAVSLQLSYQSGDIKNAEVRGKSFYWRPDANDVGTHRVTVIASNNDGETDKASFKIQVRSFNEPPRFAPLRTMTIPMNEPFTLPVKAIDPDGMNKNLIRFLGVNLPEGASINEKTGVMKWTPNIRQAGENQFRIIATDQYGAASSVDVTIKVIQNLRRKDSDG